jgi:Ni,Fe-hydrogenase III large subunit
MNVQVARKEIFESLDLIQSATKAYLSKMEQVATIYP